MAAAPARRNISLYDITECSICRETWKDPRYIPVCDHTFCLQCLKTFIQTLDENGEDTRCPNCRKQFAIPDGGLDCLPKNFLHQQLLDACHEPYEEIPVCDLCIFGITASGYCVECNQNICKTCTMSHSRALGTEHHMVVQLEDKKNPDLIKKLRSSYCQHHQEEQVKLYCNDCQKSLCTICHATKHARHECAAINDAAQGFADKLKKCHVNVEGGIAITEDYLGQINKNKNEFLEILSDNEKKLKEKEHEIINLIKSERTELWNELKEIKDKRLKEISKKEEEIKTKLLALKSFMKTSKELLEDGSASDICRSTNGLLTQADVLVEPQTESTLICNLDKIDVSFIPAMKPDVNGCEVRLVGFIHYTAYTGTVDVDQVHSSRQNQKAVTLDKMFTTLEKDVKEKDTKISSLEKDVKEKDTKISSLEKDVMKRDTNIVSFKRYAKENATRIYNLEKDIKEKDTKISSMEKDVKEKDTKIASLEKDVKENTTKISSLEKDVKEKDTKISCLDKDIKEKVSSLETQLEQVKEKHRKRKEAIIDPVRSTSTLFLSKSTMVRVIPGADKGIVWGIVVLGSQLFIARHGATSIEVYDVNKMTSTPGLLKISDETLVNPRLAVCSHYNCLYVSHLTRSAETVIYRVELFNSSVSSWTVAHYAAFSLNKFHTVLVSVYCEQQVQQRVLEYTTQGEFIREIRLDRSIDWPRHCVQLSDGNFVICHFGSKMHRVCIVDANGKIIKSYGRSQGSGGGQLSGPYQLSVDKYDHMFLADFYNNRVQLLSPALTLLGTVQIAGHLLDCPGALHFDQINHQLYVNSGNNVLVVELNIVGK